MSFNIVNVATINGTTIAYSSVPTSSTAILGPVTSSHVYKINSIIAANKTSSAAWITVLYNKSSTSYYLGYQIQVPANSTLVVVGKDNPVYLMDTTSDYIYAQAGTGSAIDLIISYEDMS